MIAENVLVVALFLVAGILAVVKLAQSRSEVLAWGLLAAAIAGVLLAT